MAQPEQVFTCDVCGLESPKGWMHKAHVATHNPTATRASLANAVKSEVGARYAPYGLVVYPILGIFTAGIGLWIWWAIQERKIAPGVAGVFRALGFTVLCFLPLGYILVASQYGRNLFYCSTPEAERMRREASADA